MEYALVYQIHRFIQKYPFLLLFHNLMQIIESESYFIAKGRYIRNVGFVDILYSGYKLITLRLTNL